mgnify:CR=1 FL=1
MLDLTMTNFLLKVLNIKKRSDIYPAMQKKMSDFDILERIA